MVRKLKVFQAHFGFFDTVVAAPSQAEALRAWDAHQNLFSNGGAKVATDEAAIAAALAHPGTPLRRAVGSNDAFQLKSSSLPNVPAEPKRAAKTRARRRESERPPADRRQLDASEAALERIEEARKIEEADLRREEDELDRAKADAQALYVERRKAAVTAVTGARKAYRASGGRD